MIDVYREQKRLFRVRLYGILTGLSVLLLTAATGMKLQGQVSAYTFAQSMGTFTPITGGTVLGTATGNVTATNLNSQVYNVTLPFAFNFNQQNYTELNVSSNGFVTFGATAPSATLSAPISASITYDGAIAAFARDLTSFYDVAGRTGNIRWETVGTAPNREVVIQWTDFRPTNTTSTTSVYAFSFQIRLQETTNRISTVYTTGSYLVGSTSYSSAINQIGLRGATNSDFNNRYNTAGTSFMNSVAGDANGDDQAFNTVNAVPGMPADGLTYTWTPPTCFSPTTVSSGAITTGTAAINWSAPAQVPAMGYEIYYNTTGTAPDGTTVLDGTNSLSISNTAVSATLSSLDAGTQYYIWIRGKCSTSDFGNWSAGITVMTDCLPVNAPYTQNFDTTSSGSSTNNTAPVCWTYYEETGSAAYGYVSTSNSVSSPHSFYMYNSSDVTGNVMLISPQTLNLSDGTKWVKFSARASANNYTMEVGTVSSPTNMGSLALLSTITLTTSHEEYTVMISAGAHQYLVFRHGLGGTYRGIYLDDITVENTPTCFEPTGLSVTAGSATTSGGVVTWTAPSTPATGYEIYYSNDPTPPVATTVLDGTNSLSVVGTTATLSGLDPATVYYIWVRTVCSAADKSVWTPISVTLTTLCQPPVITSTTGATICTGTATLSATAAAGTAIQWYDAATGGNQVGTGASFTTPALTAITDYWVSANTVGSPVSVGPVSPASLGTSSNTTTNWNLLFTVNSNLTLNSVDVFSGTAGQAGVVEILDENNVVVGSYPFTTTGAGTSTPQTVPLNIALTPGNYAMKRSGAANLYRNSVGATFPYSTPELTITGTTFVNYPAYYFYFYNLTFTGFCESPRTMVTATVDCTMGTSEADSAGSIKVYPNPFTDVINISDIRNVQSVTVLDMSGRLVKSFERPAAQLNLAGLKSGLYLINLKYKDGSSQSLKAVKK